MWTLFFFDAKDKFKEMIKQLMEWYEVVDLKTRYVSPQTDHTRCHSWQDPVLTTSEQTTRDAAKYLMQWEAKTIVWKEAQPTSSKHEIELLLVLHAPNGCFTSNRRAQKRIFHIHPECVLWEPWWNKKTGNDYQSRGWSREATHPEECAQIHTDPHSFPPRHSHWRKRARR